MKNKHVLIIGMGISGRSAAEFLLSQGASILGVDQNQELLKTNENLIRLRTLGLKTEFDGLPLDIKQFDLVVASPGVPSHHPYYVAAAQSGIQVIGEVELASRFIRNQMIGITGTNGKTTVTLMIAHVLNACGKKALALGNVGVPLAAQLLSIPSESVILVAELSSFQLETLKSPVLEVALILNITPDHLDRYSSMEEYAKSKISIKNCLTPYGKLYVQKQTYDDWKPFFEKHPVELFGYDSSCSIYSDQQNLFFKEKIDYILPPDYRGRVSHDTENLMAAYAACREMGVAAEEFFNAVKTFVKPKHRIEYVKHVGGVAYYNDSKGTNLDAVIRAVESLNGDIVLIAGGVDKGAAYTPWIKAFAGKVKCVHAIGQAADKIKQDLDASIPVEHFPSLDAAVQKAATVAKPGETILLSPGCSSFDMFRDYAHRGDEFKRIVQELKSTEGV